MSYFGSKIRQIRKERKLSLDGMSKMIGVSRNTLREWELGKKPPYYNMDSVYELAKTLKVSPTYFFDTGSEGQQLPVMREYTERMNSIEQEIREMRHTIGIMGKYFGLVANSVHKIVD